MCFESWLYRQGDTNRILNTLVNLLVFNGSKSTSNDLRPHKFHPCANNECQMPGYTLLMYAACLLSHCVITSCVTFFGFYHFKILHFILYELNLYVVLCVLSLSHFGFNTENDYLWICRVYIFLVTLFLVYNSLGTNFFYNTQDQFCIYDEKWNANWNQALTHVQPIIIKWVPSVHHYKRNSIWFFFFIIFILFYKFE